MRSKHFVTALVLVLGLLLSTGFAFASGEQEAAGSGEGTGEESVEQRTIRFSWWGGESRHNAILEAIDVFEERHQGVTVEGEFSGWSGYIDKLRTQMAADSQPDTFYNGAGGPWTVLPIAGKLNLDNVDGVRTDQLNEVQLDMIRDWSDGELTGLPRSASVRGGFVLNKTMFDELGIELPERSWTWEDFAEVAQKVHDASNGETYGALDETGGITYGSFGLRAWALSHFGVPITLENGRLGLTRDQLREMYAWWGELRESGAVTPASISVSADDQQNNPIVTGDSAMVAMSLGSFGRFQGNTEDTLVLRPFPQGEYKNNEIAPGVTMSISSATEHQELAVEFLNFMINDLEAGKILGTQVGIPANAERRQWLQESGDLGRIARLQFQTNNWVLDNLGSIPFITRPEDFTKFRDRRFSAEQALAFGETSMSETLDQIIQIAEDMDWEVPASPRDPISEQQ